MKPPPPIPHDCGRAALSAKTVAAAASIALPPDSSTARPTRAAAGDSVAITPRVVLTAGVQARALLGLRHERDHEDEQGGEAQEEPAHGGILTRERFRRPSASGRRWPVAGRSRTIEPALVRRRSAAPTSEPRPAYAQRPDMGRVSALTKSSSWPVVQHSKASQWRS